MTNLDKYIATNKIYIVSGEGAVGTREVYDGTRTMHAIKMRLTKERCGGDRWARAEIFCYSNDYGDVFVFVGK